MLFALLHHFLLRGLHSDKIADQSADCQTNPLPTASFFATDYLVFVCCRPHKARKV